MTTTILPRYGGAIEVEAVPEGWRLTCSDDEGDMVVIYLSGRDALELTRVLPPVETREARP